MQDVLPLRALRWLRAALLDWTGASARARASLDGSRAAILMYHRVLPAAEARRLAVEPGMYVTPKSFDVHLECLERDFRVLPLAEIVDRLAAGGALPERACAITFDDGWRDNLEHALPALRRRGMPATLFVVAGRVGSRGAFYLDEVARRLDALSPASRQRAAAAVADALGLAPGPPLAVFKAAQGERQDEALALLRREHAAPLEAERELLDWDELDELARADVDIEAHGLTHALLTRLPAADAAAELRRCGTLLRERGHGRQRLLAYPGGAHDAGVCRMAAEAGYRAAVTTDPGLAGASDPPLALPRLALHQDISATAAEFRRVVPRRAR